MIPEIILQRALINGFQAIRKDPRIISNLFKNLPVHLQEDVQRFILDQHIDFSTNYPRSDIKVPGVVMLLKSESEGNPFLGDIAGAPPNYEMPDQDMAIDTLGGNAASTSSMAGLPALVVGNLRVAEMTSTSSITFTEESQDVINAVFADRHTWPCLAVYVVAGAGAGQVKIITSISTNDLDTAEPFEVNLDSTSVVDIRYAEIKEETYGEPLRSYEAGNTGILRLGANYETQYQLDVLAGNQDEVIYLYVVLKAILFAQRSFLEAQGIMSLKISGTDLAPRSELLPSEVFTRSMTLQFTYPFNLLVEQDVAKSIEISMTSGVENTSVVPDVEIIAQVEL